MDTVQRIRKLHIAVSDELLQEMREHGLLQDIDYTFATLITKEIEKMKQEGDDYELQ